MSIVESPVDQTLSWRVIEERSARTENPRHRAMLNKVAEHLRAEASGDLEALLGTLGPSPEYHIWFDGRDEGPKGLDGIRGFYNQLVEDKRGVLEFAIDRIVVDDGAVLTEGWLSAIQQGRICRKYGWVVDDDDAAYLVRRRTVIIWPFDAAGEMIGEDGYTSTDLGAARKLEPEELPDAYTSLFADA